jgi:hypothetical protein
MAQTAELLPYQEKDDSMSISKNSICVSDVSFAC